MSPQVTPAIIAAGVGVLTAIATVVMQYSAAGKPAGILRGIEEQREQLDRTLAEQRTRTLNERFATAAEQLGMISGRRSGWRGCMPWRAWRMTGTRTGRPALTCCAAICACPTIRTLAGMHPG